MQSKYDVMSSNNDKILLEGYVPLHSLQVVAIGKQYSQRRKFKYTPVYFAKEF